MESQQLCSLKKYMHKSHFYKLNHAINAPKAYLKKCKLESFHTKNNQGAEDVNRLVEYLSIRLRRLESSILSTA